MAISESAWDIILAIIQGKMIILRITWFWINPWLLHRNWNGKASRKDLCGDSVGFHLLYWVPPMWWLTAEGKEVSPVYTNFTVVRMQILIRCLQRPKIESTSFRRDVSWMLKKKDSGLGGWRDLSQCLPQGCFCKHNLLLMQLCSADIVPDLKIWMWLIVCKPRPCLEKKVTYIVYINTKQRFEALCDTLILVAFGGQLKSLRNWSP